MLLERLRSETRCFHQAVEDELDLLRPSITINDYTRLLLAFHGYLAPWERRTSPILVVQERTFAAEREKTVRLVADLNAVTGGHAWHAHAQECQQLPLLSSPAAAWGSAYVWEGATLGGQLLSRHFASALGLNAPHGLSYFSGYGEQTGAMWKAFKELLQQRVPASSESEAVQAAVQTFQTLQAWLRHTGVARQRTPRQDATQAQEPSYGRL